MKLPKVNEWEGRAGALAGLYRRRLLHDRCVDVRGLVTYYTTFVIELHARRSMCSAQRHTPDEAFMMQRLREVMGDDAGIVRDGRILSCDRDDAA